MQTTTVLVIDGKAYASQILREIDSSEFMGMMQSGVVNIERDTPPLPDHCRWVFNASLSVQYVIELKPAILPIKHVNWRRSYNVAFPWQYFVLSFTRDTPNVQHWYWSSPRLGWSKNRINHLDDPYLSRPSLPNIFESSTEICVGSTAPDSTLTPEERVNEFVSGFFSEGSEFNDDLDWHYPSDYQTILEWVRDSKDDSYCWRNWAMNPHISLYELLQRDQYDRSGNRITPVSSLDDFVERALVTGRRPW